MSKTENEVAVDLETQVRAPWPTVGNGESSALLKSLKRSQRAQEVAQEKVRKNPNLFKGWSIGKTDPNHQFLMQNRGQFGTRQHRKLK